jgi:hypothetical protein
MQIIADLWPIIESAQLGKCVHNTDQIRPLVAMCLEIRAHKFRKNLFKA